VFGRVLAPYGVPMRSGDKRGTRVHESEPFKSGELGSSSSGSIPAVYTTNYLELFMFSDIQNGATQSRLKTARPRGCASSLFDTPTKSLTLLGTLRGQANRPSSCEPCSSGEHGSPICAR